MFETKFTKETLGCTNDKIEIVGFTIKHKSKKYPVDGRRIIITLGSGDVLTACFAVDSKFSSVKGFTIDDMINSTYAYGYELEVDEYISEDGSTVEVYTGEEPLTEEKTEV